MRGGSKSASISKPSTSFFQYCSKYFDAFYAWLMEPVHASSLCTFRIVYSYVMLAQIMKWAPMFDLFQTTIHTLHYPGLGWIKPVSPVVGNFMLGTSSLCSIALGIGFMTRVVSVLNFLIFGYLFHICHSFYNNHYVLMCHINFVGCFVNWGTWGALDVFLRKRGGKRVETTVPYWHLLLMQLLFCVPYFWGSVAKMNNDWLFRGQPLISWFGSRNGWLYRQWWFPWFIAWSGMLYDLTISFLLLWKRTRFLLGFPGAIFFNCCNKIMFNIGVFPFAMIASLVLFLDADHPAKLWRLLTTLPSATETPKESAWVLKIEDAADENAKHKRRAPRSSLHKRYVLTFVISFLLFHTLYPLRHFVLYKSNPSWTEEGHTGAWHMKLRSKHGWVYLKFTEKNGTVTFLTPYSDPHVSRHQTRKIEARPDDLLTYVARVKQLFEEAQRPLAEINAFSCFSLNENLHRELFVSSANLIDYIGKYEWIGVSGVGKWIHAHATAPLCDRHNPFSKKLDAGKQAATDFRDLYYQANFRTAEELNLEFESRANVYHVPKDSADPSAREYGYMWNI